MLSSVPRAHAAVLNLALAAAYIVVARLGLRMDAVSGFATLVWPATGISLVAMLLFGYRVWPGIALGALVTTLGIGAPPAVACGIALGNTLEAFAGAWAMKRLTGGYPSFSRVRDVLVLVGLAAVASTGISATLGVASLRLGGIIPVGDALGTWRAWWIGDAMGDLVVVPLLLGMAARGDGPRETAARPRLPEALALGGLLVATNLFVFGMREDRDSSMLREAYLVFPLLVWAGLRFGARGAAWVNFVVSAVAITGTAAGRGPFQMASLSQSLLHLQAFMVIVAATTLILGSVSDEQQASPSACATHSSPWLLTSSGRR